MLLAVLLSVLLLPATNLIREGTDWAIVAHLLGNVDDHAKEVDRRAQGQIASLTNVIDRACPCYRYRDHHRRAADCDEHRLCRPNPLPHRLVVASLKPWRPAGRVS